MTSSEPAPALRLVDAPAAFTNQPIDERGDGVGAGRRDRLLRHRAHRAVGLWYRQRDDAGLALDLGRPCGQRDVIGLAAVDGSGHRLRKGDVHAGLDRRHGPEIRGQVEQRGSLPEQQLLDALVEHHVGAPEAVDGLLGVTDDEQLARHHAHAVEIADGGVRAGEQQKYLGLQRIGVLKLIDEKMAEALLQVFAHVAVLHQHVARERQQVHEVQDAGLLFELLVGFNDRRQLLAKARREICLGQDDELGDRGSSRVARGDDSRAVERRSVQHSAPGVLEISLVVALEAGQLGLQTVVVARCQLLTGGELLSQTCTP